MNILRTIEKSIITHIDDGNKPKLDITNKMIQTFFTDKRALEDIDQQKYNKYIALYENERIKNNIEYDLYLNNRAELLNAFKKSNVKSDLINLLKFQRPPMKQVPDIYSYSIMNIKDNREPAVKPAVKPPVKPPKAEKECPEGKILNPKTGRCIADPALKKDKK